MVRARLPPSAARAPRGMAGRFSGCGLSAAGLQGIETDSPTSATTAPPTTVDGGPPRNPRPRRRSQRPARARRGRVGRPCRVGRILARLTIPAEAEARVEQPAQARTRCRRPRQLARSARARSGRLRTPWTSVRRPSSRGSSIYARPAPATGRRARNAPPWTRDWFRGARRRASRRTSEHAPAATRPARARPLPLQHVHARLTRGATARNHPSRRLQRARAARQMPTRRRSQPAGP